MHKDLHHSFWLDAELGRLCATIVGRLLHFANTALSDYEMTVLAKEFSWDYLCGIGAKLLQNTLNFCMQVEFNKRYAIHLLQVKWFYTNECSQHKWCWTLKRLQDKLEMQNSIMSE